VEAARAVWEMVGEEHLLNPVAGGAALLFHGVVIPTSDTDLAITGGSLNKFHGLSKNDKQFPQALPANS